MFVFDAESVLFQIYSAGCALQVAHGGSLQVHGHLRGGGILVLPLGQRPHSGRTAGDDCLPTAQQKHSNSAQQSVRNDRVLPVLLGVPHPGVPVLGTDHLGVGETQLQPRLLLGAVLRAHLPH